MEDAWRPSCSGRSASWARSFDAPQSMTTMHICEKRSEASERTASESRCSLRSTCVRIRALALCSTVDSQQKAPIPKMCCCRKTRSRSTTKGSESSSHRAPACSSRRSAPSAAAAAAACCSCCSPWALRAIATVRAFDTTWSTKSGAAAGAAAARCRARPSSVLSSSEGPPSIARSSPVVSSARVAGSVVIEATSSTPWLKPALQTRHIGIAEASSTRAPSVKSKGRQPAARRALYHGNMKYHGHSCGKWYRYHGSTGILARHVARRPECRCS